LQTPPIPASEEARLAALRLLNILDTQPEERFDRLTRMARRMFSVPVAHVTLVDAERQWHKSSSGSAPRETHRDISFCSHAILDDAVLHVPDAFLDERFFDNPQVLDGPRIRFYAGCPLKVGSENLGTLCVIDEKPHEFGDEDLQLLKDLAEMAEMELVAVQLATTDYLTSLSNRRGFEALARHSLSVCRRTDRPATMLFFDLDRFKEINDTRGHAEGDNALMTFSQGLLHVFRESDVIGRIGGDEFAVLLSGAEGENVAEVLPRLREWLTINHSAAEMGYEILFSVGLIDFDVEKHETIEHLLAEADAAMYGNKRAARA